MALDLRTPVLVGVGAVQQRLDDSQAALEPVELMIAALERAAADAGSRALLGKADSIRVPRGFWDYSDPGRIIAERFGATAAHTQVAEIGVLQTTLLGLAAQAIAAGEEEVVLVAGGEAKYRSLRAQFAGVPAPSTEQVAVKPDSVLRPEREIWSQFEGDLGLMMPVTQYSIMETALRRAEGLSIDAHRREVARLWADFSRVAADNPSAWNREPVSAADIAATGRGNRMLAFPYTKLHNSQWNVDQAAGLIFCSVAAAGAAGIPESQWIFPLAVADSNHMVPLSERAELHRSHGFRIAGQRALESAGLGIHAVEHLELYSCFPVAVRVQARELGIRAGRRLTVTGGMAFAGGPLNNFVLQALVRMAETLRADRGSAGMVTAVSGMLTKQGVSLWSTRPPAQPFHFADVTREVAQEMTAVEVVGEYEGPAAVAAYTVLYENDAPARAVMICDLSDGRRTLAVTMDPQVAGAMTEREHCGCSVRIGADRAVTEVAFEEP
jgi:acetyl-CoA C-acetyltransferase